MANNLALGLVIGGAVSSSVGAAFKDVEGRIKKLGEQGTKARILQSTIGDTMRLRDEWKKAHDTGAASAGGLLKQLESNLKTLKEQGIEVGKLRKEYQALGQVARGAELKALGHTQIQQGKEGMKSSLGQAAALTASLAIPTKISGDYQAQIRQMSLWAHTAGTGDEAELAASISKVAADKGMSQQLLAKSVGALIEKGVEWQEATDYAGQIADLIDGQGMEPETIATLINSFKEAGVKQADMGAMLGQVAAAGDIGAFGPKDMAKYLPSMLGNIKRLGMEGPEAVRFLGASLQSQFSQTQDSAAAATNMNNLLNAVISSTSQERFAKEGYDLAGSILAATKSGKAANPVEAFILLSEEMIKRQDPAKAKKIEALKARIRASADGSAEEEQAMVALTEAAGLANIVSDQSASAGLLAQIKYGDKIKADMATIKDTDGKAKIEADAAKARETSNRKWSAATSSMEASMISLGDAIRPLTDMAADGLGKVGYALANLSDKYKPVVAGAAMLATGMVALGAAVNAIKIGKGLLNVGRGTLMGNPNIAQKVFVTNPSTGGGAGIEGREGKRGRGKGKRGKGGRGSITSPATASPVGAAASRFAPKAMMGKGAGFVKGAAPFAAIEAMMIAADTYQNAETRDEKAEGYGNAAGTLAGTLAGAAAGAAIGSVVPVIGTVVGGLIGGYLGSWGGGELGGAVGKAAFGGTDTPPERLMLPAQPSPLRLPPPGAVPMPRLGQMAPALATGPLMLKAPVANAPAMGDVSRSLAVAPTSVPVPALLAAAPATKPASTQVDQQWTFAPTMPVTVQGDVKDPRQLAQSMMPYMRQLFEDFSREQARRNLFDAPHV
ncbi:Phage-related minor tail protein [Pseudomonas sp. ok272]|uniref:phage tail tape measure protein n=1 Tax=unclassified Pseudomonas TaxID=196821 RepID=UPI0008C188BD|nr:MULTISPECIES: phage tail tape measure protein [unclassified Pseudomonas]SEN18687.1 Phage-related minor tail protein [Pseudomonas sp. ok272]SFN10629.1 Phage-related minor tail protein [Pseudomonas sp. ok602]